MEKGVCEGGSGGGMGMGNFSPEGKLAPGTYDSPLHPLRRSSNGTDGSKTSGAGMFLGMGAGMGAGFSLGEVSSASARSEDVRSSNFDFQDDTGNLAEQISRPPTPATPQTVAS